MIRLGLLGMGTVGGSLADLIRQQHDDVLARTGYDLTITRAAVRDLNKPRAVAADRLTTDPMEVAVADDVDVVVELMGGIEGTREVVRAALMAGKPVVTGNKALLAAHGAELFALAAESGTALLFEAAVAGGIPLMRALEQSLRGEPIERVLGILNGTTNYILTQMSDNGSSYDAALAQAQSLGYAEADPTADVEGHDAAAKAAIIATVSFGTDVTIDDVPATGISSVTARDIATAKRFGYVIKLLAVIERLPNGSDTEIAVQVSPTLVPASHPLAAVNDAFNAVFINGGAVGELMLYGPGAGGYPTASAVLGDILSAADGVAEGFGSLARRRGDANLRIRELSELESAFLIEVDVTDEPGVLSTVAGVFGANSVSIRSMEQTGMATEARLEFITHTARQADVDATIAKLDELDVVRSVGTVIRVLS